MRILLTGFASVLLLVVAGCGSDPAADDVKITAPIDNNSPAAKAAGGAPPPNPDVPPPGGGFKKGSG